MKNHRGKTLLFLALFLLPLPETGSAITLDVNLKAGGQQKFDISLVRKITYDMNAPIKMTVALTDNTSPSFDISAIRSITFGGKPSKNDSPLVDRLASQLALLSTRRSGAAASLQFSINKPSQVEVRLYAMNGSLIRIISRGWFAAGSHVVFWDGTGRRGTRLGSGNYILTISGIGQSQAFKFVTVK
jgi:hypothetical protein